MIRVAIGGWGAWVQRPGYRADLHGIAESRRLAHQMKEGGRWGNLVLVEEGECDFTVVLNHDHNKEHDPKTSIIVPVIEPWHSPGKYGAWGRHLYPLPNPRSFFAVLTHPCAYWSGSPGLTYEKASMPVLETKQDAIASCPGEKYCLEGHVKRIDLIRAADGLIHSYGTVINLCDLKGYIGPADQSVDAMRSYKYYFICENVREKGYMSEKLWEPIISETLCFYDGAPDAADYVDADAFVPVDASNVEETLATIRQAIAEDWWSTRIGTIRRMKDKILNELQLWPQIERVINERLNPGLDRISRDDEHEWEYLEGIDAMGNDVCLNQASGLTDREAARMLGSVCAAYNTFGYLKHSVPNLGPTKTEGLGIWLRKEIITDAMRLDIDKMIAAEEEKETDGT